MAALKFLILCLCALMNLINADSTRDLASSTASRGSVPIIEIGGDSIPEPIGGGVPATTPGQYSFVSSGVNPGSAPPSVQFNKVADRHFQTANAQFQEFNNQVINAQKVIVADLNAKLTSGQGTGFISSGSGGNGFIGASPAGFVSSEGPSQFGNLNPENINKQTIFTQSYVSKPVITTKFYTVQTSSLAGSTDINGQKTTFKKAQINVNDNGKVTTYKLGDP